ncbi:zona pellucida sperm-binding protein 3-like [Mugil cephalus]|uniref:zona pellucida sperm-binding protein 3-like n=1 Tax=Mugil cephalus TaxID=48193 RepID=UPI001FB7B289|nr:zona pellucida sperm-binding protein 3-like [Mugil cephalus]
MSPIYVFVMFYQYIVSALVTVECHTYQSKPLFLSYSDLAALEANRQDQPDKPDSHFRNHAGIMTSAGEDKVKTFALKCHEDGIEIVMKALLFGPAEPTQLRLGPVRAAQDHCAAKVSGKGEYVIKAPLSGCGNKVTFTESSVLLSNLLLYSPPPSSPGDTSQVEAAAIPVQCEYSRRYIVSSRALRPTWSPLVSVPSAHLTLDFHLRLMTGDWSTERKSSVYFLGEMVNIEASVNHRHLPLRLYVHSCVATLSPGVNSNPRYLFIDHQGCFTDSQLSGSSSRFLPRAQSNFLQIQLEPFLFHQDDRHTIYAMCHLEAVPVSKTDPLKKACSFINGRWRSVDGDDNVCESCEVAHSSSSSSTFGHKTVPRSNSRHRQNELHREKTLGPVLFLPWKSETSGNHKYL